MFQAIRRHWLRWPAFEMTPARKRRAVRWGGLFLFEFTVVLLGVLAAQQLQDYGVRARAEDDARGAIERALAETANARGMATYWLVVAPCLSGRLEQLMRAASQGNQIPAHFLDRPAMPFAPASKWSEATVLAARRAYGDQLVTDFSDVADMSQHMASITRELSGDWAALKLVDPALGPPSPADRANARLAAARIKARLDSLTATARTLIATAARRGVHHSSRVIRPPAGCSA